MINSKAEIDSSARIAKNVTIGPWSVIGADVEIGEGCEIGPHAVIKGPTKIGKNNKIFQFTSVGEDPQDKKYRGEHTTLEIGDDNTFREFCTVHRGTEGGGGKTAIGNDNLFMNYVHVAHDCIIGNGTVFANSASLAGHVDVHDYVILGGFSGVRQFCTLGAHSFLAKGAMVPKDVLPFTLVTGPGAKVNGLNTVGLERHQFSAETLSALKQAYRIIYRQDLSIADAIEKLNSLASEHPQVQLMVDMLEKTELGITR